MVKDAVSVIGGAVASRYITQFALGGKNVGVWGYLGNLVAALALGWAAKKTFRSPRVGNLVTLGGVTGLVLRVVQDVTPVGKYINLSLTGARKGGDIGIGIIQPSSFYVPQVPTNGSMTQFITPSTVSAAIAQSGLRGVPQSVMNRTTRGVISS